MEQLPYASHFCATITNRFVRRLLSAPGMLSRTSDSEAARYADGSEMILCPWTRLKRILRGRFLCTGSPSLRS
jgi:hypothetical protein